MWIQGAMPCILLAFVLVSVRTVRIVPVFLYGSESWTLRGMGHGVWHTKYRFLGIVYEIWSNL